MAVGEETRTSLRISQPRLRKLKALKRDWNMPSNDELIGFLIDIADTEKMQPLAQRHVGRLKVEEAKEKQRRAQLDKLMRNLSAEEIDKLISKGI